MLYNRREYPVHAVRYHKGLYDIQWYSVVPAEVLPALLVFNLPFTFVKAMVSVVVTLFIYKPLSPIIKGNYK